MCRRSTPFGAARRGGRAARRAHRWRPELAHGVVAPRGGAGRAPGGRAPRGGDHRKPACAHRQDPRAVLCRVHRLPRAPAERRRRRRHRLRAALRDERHGRARAGASARGRECRAGRRCAAYAVDVPQQRQAVQRRRLAPPAAHRRGQPRPRAHRRVRRRLLLAVQHLRGADRALWRRAPGLLLEGRRAVHAARAGAADGRVRDGHALDDVFDGAA